MISFVRNDCRYVPSKPVNILLVLGKPGRVVLSNDSCHVQKIAVMEMVVVVVSITKVNPGISRAGLVDDAAPRSLVRRQRGRRRLKPIVE